MQLNGTRPQAQLMSWKPAFAWHLIPEQTGLRLDLERCLHCYSTERAHTGRWTRGRTLTKSSGRQR
jgi:hypothetical protein